MASRAARSTWSASRLDDAALHQPARELGDALDLVGNRSELLVEDDAVELLGLLLERDLEVLLPEEAGIGETRGEHPAVALDDCGAAVIRSDVRDAHESWRKQPSTQCRRNISGWCAW